MKETHILTQLTNYLEMDALGLFTGLLGVLGSLVFVNGKKMSYARALVLSLVAMVVCGYTMPVIESIVRVRPLALVINVLVGFLAIEIFVALKLKSPWIASKIVDKGADKVGLNKTEKP